MAKSPRRSPPSIEGDPGTGKTTLGVRPALDLVPRDPGIAGIRLPLRDDALKSVEEKASAITSSRTVSASCPAVEARGA